MTEKFKRMYIWQKWFTKKNENGKEEDVRRMEVPVGDGTGNLHEFLIPKDRAQVVVELESWSVTWYVKTGWSNTTERRAKMFVSLDDAREFEKQIIKSAEFLGCWVEVSLEKN